MTQEERLAAYAARKASKLAALKEKYKPNNDEEDAAIAIRDAKYGKKDNPEAITRRIQSSQAAMKRKWEYNAQLYKEEKRREATY